MTMPIIDLMINDGAPIYYGQAWLRLIESHLTYLKTNVGTVVRSVEPHHAYKYEGDLYGLLLFYGVSPEYHHVVMRMNDLTSPTDYTADLLNLLVPARTTVEALRQVFQTTYKKIN